MRIRAFIITCLSFFILFGCTKVGGEAHVNKPIPLNTPYTLPTDAYLALANQHTGEEKSSLLLMAAGREIYAGHWEKGQQWLQTLTDLSREQQDEKQILLAKIALTRSIALEAMHQLSGVKQVTALPLFYQIQYHTILAHVYQLRAQLAESVGERLLLDHLLPSETEQLHNRRMIWLTLISLPQAELTTMSVEWSQTPEWQGWLKLAAIANMKGLGKESLLNLLRHWKAEFPNHPAASLLSTHLASGEPLLFPAPHRIALLLPMTGTLAGPGTAIYDGFTAAYHQSDSAPTLAFRVYDTARAPVQQLYEQAIRDGAQFVIGPLSKSDVAQIAQLPHPVPTLLLNEVDRPLTPNAYFFGLSPTQEARQIAMKARQQGYQRALFVAPAGSWGGEVSSSLIQAWTQRGGKLVESLVYEPNTALAPAIQNLLQYHESTVDVKSKKSMGSRRQDFDVIFLIAYPSKAREIVPLLRYYYAGNVPLFSTSAIYTGSPDTKQDRDLEGITFCDMPFVFNEALPNKHWPEQLNGYSRLYALGWDGYALTTQLNALLLFPAVGINEKTGILYLTSRHQIERVLAWGQFKQGQAQRLSGR